MQNPVPTKRQMFARKVVPALALGAAALAATACGGSGSESATTDTIASTSSTSSTSVSSTTSAPAPKQPCTGDYLTTAARGEYPNAVIDDEACSSAFAIATLEGDTLQGGIGVGFFGVGEDGAWRLIKVVAPGGDLNADMPPGMPVGLPSGWLSRYQARTARSAADAPSATDQPPIPEGPAVPS